MSHRFSRIATILICVLLLAALLRDVISNDRPLFCRVEGKVYFPAFRCLFGEPSGDSWQAPFDVIQRDNLWHSFDYQSVVFAPVPFRAGQEVRRAKWLPPFSVSEMGNRKFRHWLGTDGNGYDVAAGMIAGARVTVTIGVLTVLMSSLLGIFLGAMSGFWGDDRLKTSRARLFANLIAIPIAIFYITVPFQFEWTQDLDAYTTGQMLLVFLSIFVIFNFLGNIAARYSTFFSKKITLPVDFGVMRLAEIFDAIPGLVLVMAVAAVAVKSRLSLEMLVVVIGALSWMNFARLVRAELLRVRELEFVQSARSIGVSEWQILWRHALPNAIRPVLIALCLSMAGAILLESSLSFLGLTAMQGGSSWGSLLESGRGYYQFWWVSVFPGAAIFGVVLSLHTWADEYAQRR